MAEREIDKQYTNIAAGDIGTQIFWFDKNRISGVTASEGLTVSVDEKKYLKKANYATSITFTYATTGTTWKIGADSVDLDEYGVTLTTGSPSDGNTIKIDYAGGKFEYALPVTAGAEFGGDVESFEAPETDLDFVPKIGGRTTLNDISYTINYTADKYKRIKEISDNTDFNIYMEVLSDGSAMVFKGTSGMPAITSGDVRQITWTIIPSVVVFVDNIANMSDSCKTDLTSLNAGLVNGNAISIDVSTIPNIRQDYYASKNLANS